MRAMILAIFIFLSFSGITMNGNRKETRRFLGTEIPLIKMDNQYWVSLYDLKSVGKNNQLGDDFKRAVRNRKATYVRHNKENSDKISICLHKNLIGKIDKKHLSPNKKCIFLCAKEFIEKSGAFYRILDQYNLTLASESEAIEVKELTDSENTKRKQSKNVDVANKRPRNNNDIILNPNYYDENPFDEYFKDIEFDGDTYVNALSSPSHFHTLTGEYYSAYITKTKNTL